MEKAPVPERGLFLLLAGCGIGPWKAASTSRNRLAATTTQYHHSTVPYFLVLRQVSDRFAEHPEFGIEIVDDRQPFRRSHLLIRLELACHANQYTSEEPAVRFIAWMAG
jgi:hypothetical protein